jgi:hypothetical protein
MVSRQLPSSGWEVLEAEHGREALDVLAVERPDVILLDLMMPEMDGFECLSHLRASDEISDLPVVVMTAMELSASEVATLNRSVQRVLQKGTVGQLEPVDELRCRLGPAV